MPLVRTQANTPTPTEANAQANTRATRSRKAACPAAPPLGDLHTDKPCGNCGGVVPTWRDTAGSGEYHCGECLKDFITWQRGELAKSQAALLLLLQFQRQRAA